MSSILIKSATIVNEGKQMVADVLIRDGKIERIDPRIQAQADDMIDAEGLHLLPGMIDDQVHFREPGLTYKADIGTESRAAVAGGITSFMEMPNTVPNTLTQELLEDKYQLGAQKSVANYSFYMGAGNDNLDEVLRTDASRVCGVKVFMGSSTGNMLVDDESTLENLFSRSPMLIAVHCEDEQTIRRNLEQAKNSYGRDITPEMHPLIRSAEACYLSSSKAVRLAEKHNTRLHILHISTERELSLFRNDIPLAEKRITAEACVHHLWFSDADYRIRGNDIKWNPAVKTQQDRDAIRRAVLDNRIDVIATDHAPHTVEEKQRDYLDCPSGGPLVQHALPALLEMYHEGVFTLENIAQKMAHSVADCFQIEKRGYIREGYWADLTLVALKAPWTVQSSQVLSKCGWTPFQGQVFRSRITHTIVSGKLAYRQGNIVQEVRGERMTFNR
ncbi:MAG: dihydroorotase [Mucilaginibacter polytrichastri]|nr:dihydroorotase [Mucilaginibacter polytrichastri]